MNMIINYIKEYVKKFVNFYLTAMNNYGEAINNSRGLVGA